MNKGYRPLIIEDVNGKKNLINCYEVVIVAPSDRESLYGISLSTRSAIIVDERVAEILMDRLTDELFFAPESIERQKAILNPVEED
jgi:hypothetical protein